MVVKLQEIIHRRVDEHELRSLRTVGDVVEMVAAASASARV
jgi:acyl carrier protein